jgi:hypothetical protein
MDKNLRERLRSQDFTTKLLNFEIDVDAFNRLCSDLRSLSVVWRHELMIDKETAWLIFDIPKVAINAAREAEKRGLSTAGRIWDMALEVDDLVLNCFYDERF